MLMQLSFVMSSILCAVYSDLVVDPVRVAVNAVCCIQPSVGLTDYAPAYTGHEQCCHPFIHLSVCSMHYSQTAHAVAMIAIEH